MAKPFVFVLMPFSKEFDSVYDYGILRACKDSGMYCERVDKQLYDERILDRIYNQIIKADYIIADLSGENANVFYETGYAHALNKKVILVNSSSKKIPFDLKHHPQIIYNNDKTELYGQIRKKLDWYKSNPERILPPNLEQLSFFIDGVPIVKDAQITPNFTESIENSSLSFSVDVLNSSERLFKDNCEIWLELDSSNILKGKTGVQLPNNQVGVMLFGGVIDKILPRSFAKLNFELIIIKHFAREIPNANLKIFSEIETKLIPFQIVLKPKPSLKLRVI